MAKMSLRYAPEDNNKIVALAKEYTDKLQVISEAFLGYLPEIKSALSLRIDPPNIERISYTMDKAKALLPITADMAQEISQRIEHGSIEETRRSEMRLVLAELESAIKSVARITNSKEISNFTSKTYQK